MAHSVECGERQEKEPGLSPRPLVAEPQSNYYDAANDED
jgi:hypothetical protein